jgi:hypothetical protein
MRWMELWLRFIEIYTILRILRQNWNQQFYKRWRIDYSALIFLSGGAGESVLADNPPPCKLKMTNK